MLYSLCFWYKQDVRLSVCLSVTLADSDNIVQQKVEIVT